MTRPLGGPGKLPGNRFRRGGCPSGILMGSGWARRGEQAGKLFPHDLAPAGCAL